VCICPNGYTGRTCEIDLKLSYMMYTKSSYNMQSQKLIMNTTPETISSVDDLGDKVAAIKFMSDAEAKETYDEEQTTSSEEIDYTMAGGGLKLTTTSMPANPCLTERCKNNGTCVMSFSHAKNKFSFVCKCQRGYSGPLCERKANACTPNPCKSPASECIPLGRKRFECVCENGADCFVASSKASTTTTTTTPMTTVSARTRTSVPRTVTRSTMAPLFVPSSTFEIEPASTEIEWDATTVVYSPLSTPASVSLDTSVSLDAKANPKKFGQYELNESESITADALKSLKSVAGENDSLTFEDNPCNLDADICRKMPYGNDSFLCVKSFLSQDYTLCLPSRLINCRNSNPCLNGGICIDHIQPMPGDDVNKPSWRCLCSNEYTGRLCESQICSPVHRLFVNHTMCLPNSPHLTSTIMTNADMDLILDMHNAIRRQVAPIAANMQKMYWDIRLQHLAQKRAQLCSVENTGILMRQQPGYGIVIGENLAAGKFDCCGEFCFFICSIFF
jgi:hypothetical protein